MSIEDQQDYDNISTQYDIIEALPHSHVSQDLVSTGIGDCTGQYILDLGGGSGLHARNAIARGAAAVHNVDLSSEMLNNCNATEINAGRKPGERIECFVGDVTKPLDHLNLPGRPDLSEPGLYDAVLMIWTFDHATKMTELEAMWSNVSRHCRIGGKLISIRSTDPRVRPSNLAKYGVHPHNIVDVDGGVRYDFTVGFEGQKGRFTARSTNLEANFELEKSRHLAKTYGFDRLEVVDTAAMETVKKDEEYWREFVEHPAFICVVASKVC